jgi:hypothetical protein
MVRLVGRVSRYGDLQKIVLLAALFLVAPLALLAPPEPPKGQRIALADGQLFIPDGFRAGDKGIDLFLHLHGSARVTEANFVRSGHSGVLVTVVIPGLSSVYTKRFQDGKVFPRILEEVQTKLKELKLADTAGIRRVIVSSFSAGYGGVREMLKGQAAFDRIDALVLADTVFASYEGDPAQHKVNADHMAGFVKFAKLARGWKEMDDPVSLRASARRLRQHCGNGRLSACRFASPA